MDRRVGVALALAVLAAVVTADAFVALHKGGDFDVFVDAGERLLSGRPLYADSGVGGGVVGPPFQAVFFAPFAALARLSPFAAKLTWYLASWAALALAVLAWRLAVGGDHRSSSIAALPALAAIALPLQTNFEHLNLNPLLLLLLGLAAARRSEAQRGVALGIAVALKVFPGLWIVYLLARRLWKTAGTACATAAVLTALPLLRYGAAGYAADARRWWEISARGGWPIRGNNQSLIATAGRYFGEAGLKASGLLSTTDARPYWIGVIAAAALLALVGAVAVRRHGRPVTAAELALVTGVAVLLSPIAWDHYWVLFFPAFYAVWSRPRLNPCPTGEPRAGSQPPGPPVRASDRRAAAVFWIAAVLTSGFSRVTVGAGGVALARAVSTTCWAGVLLVGFLGWRLALDRKSSSPTSSPRSSPTDPSA